MRVARRTGLVLLVLGVVCPTAPAQEPIPLGQAVEEGKVEAEITGLGGSTGDAIQIRVRRKVPQILRLTLAPGTVFKSVSGNAQDMVAAGIKGERVGEMTYRPTSQIVLSDDAEHRFVVEAFCLDFHKPNPTSKHAFALSPSDVRAAAVLSLGKEKAAPMKVIQSALWIDRERVTDTELKRRFSVNAEEIEQARQLIQETQRARDIGRRGSPASATYRLRPGDKRRLVLGPGESATFEFLVTPRARYHFKVSTTGSDAIKLASRPTRVIRGRIAAIRDESVVFSVNEEHPLEVVVERGPDTAAESYVITNVGERTTPELTVCLFSPQRPGPVPAVSLACRAISGQ